MRMLILSILFVLTATASAQVKTVRLVSRMDQTHELDDASVVNMWGYGLLNWDGTYKVTLPGPTLEFELGDTVEIHFYNQSPEDHTIHLHGLDVSQSEDGVPATSTAVVQNDSIIYNFVANNVGTFLYHCHVLTTLHLDMGMYGMIVVKNKPEGNLIYAGGPSYQNEYRFLASDMDKSINDNPISVPGGFHMMVQDYFMINGKAGVMLDNPDDHVYAHVGDSVLLRIANVGYTKTRWIFPSELNATAYMSDGRQLPAPFESDTLELYPGERFSVLLVPDLYTDDPIQVEYIELRNGLWQYSNNILVNGDLGIYTSADPQFAITPNLVDYSFRFMTEVPGDKLVIMNVSGDVVGQFIIQDFVSDLDVSTYAPGLYIAVYKGRGIKFIRR